MRATKRSQVVVRRARLNRRQAHRRTATRTLRALVLFVEHGLPPSIRCSEFASEPTGRFRIERVRYNNADLNVIALGAFEQSLFEPHRSRRDTFQHHSRLAMRTARALNTCQEKLG
jgi:hypothetical protein